MRDLFLLLRDVCLLRRGPQDLPYAPNLVVVLAFASVVLEVLPALRVQPFEVAFLRALIGIAALLALPRIALGLADKASRYVQVALALLGANLAFTLLVLPLVFAIGTPPGKPEDITAAQALMSLVGMVLLGWHITVRAHIFRHAFEVPMAAGVLLAIVFAIIELFAAMLVFGGGSAAAT